MVALIAIPMTCVVGGGILAAIAIPAFSRYNKRSKTSEAFANLATMCSGVRSYAMASAERGGSLSLPPSAPRTPYRVPAGVREQVPRSAWLGNTWEQLGFSTLGPQYYSYEFVNQGSTFVLRAYGDLDGDGVLSTFERAGSITPTGEIECGALTVQNELE